MSDYEHAMFQIDLKRISGLNFWFNFVLKAESQMKRPF